MMDRKKERKGQAGFTLIELLIVVAILGILAAVVIPNVGRFLGRGGDEARRTEFQAVQSAITALMVENNLSGIPNPITAAVAPCTAGAKDMKLFPDITSDDSGSDKLNDPSGTAYLFPVAGADVVGYVLHTHDIAADDSATPTVNYVTFDTSSNCYLTTADGTVRQFLEDGTEQFN